jgi:hypothetical protein
VRKMLRISVPLLIYTILSILQREFTARRRRAGHLQDDEVPRF